MQQAQFDQFLEFQALQFQQFKQFQQKQVDQWLEYNNNSTGPSTVPTTTTRQTQNKSGPKRRRPAKKREGTGKKQNAPRHKRARSLSQPTPISSTSSDPVIFEVEPIDDEDEEDSMNFFPFVTLVNPDAEQTQESEEEPNLLDYFAHFLANNAGQFPEAFARSFSREGEGVPQRCEVPRSFQPRPQTQSFSQRFPNENRTSRVPSVPVRKGASVTTENVEPENPISDEERCMMVFDKMKKEYDAILIDLEQHERNLNSCEIAQGKMMKLLLSLDDIHCPDHLRPLRKSIASKINETLDEFEQLKSHLESHHPPKPNNSFKENLPDVKEPSEDHAHVSFKTSVEVISEEAGKEEHSFVPLSDDEESPSSKQENVNLDEPQPTFVKQNPEEETEVLNGKENNV